MSSKITKPNLLAASTEIKILHALLAEAKSAIKVYKAKQKITSVSYSFDWDALPLLKAELTKSKILSYIKFIAFQGVTEHKKWLLKQIILQAKLPSRSTCPMTNIQHQEQLSIDSVIYSKLYLEIL